MKKSVMVGVILILVGIFLIWFENSLGEQTKNVAIIFCLVGVILISIKNTWREKTPSMNFGLVGGFILIVIGILLGLIFKFSSIQMVFGLEADMAIVLGAGIIYYTLGRNLTEPNVTYFLFLTLQSFIVGFLLGGAVGGIYEFFKKHTSYKKPKI